MYVAQQHDGNDWFGTVRGVTSGTWWLCSGAERIHSKGKYVKNNNEDVRTARQGAHLIIDAINVWKVEISNPAGTMEKNVSLKMHIGSTRGEFVRTYSYMIKRFMIQAVARGKAAAVAGFRAAACRPLSAVPANLGLGSALPAVGWLCFSRGRFEPNLIGQNGGRAARTMHQAAHGAVGNAASTAPILAAVCDPKLLPTIALPHQYYILMHLLRAALTA